ncbi:MAG: dehypoxanthine futalosine cyclase [Desulfovibrio sp.]|nr:dehypoxanthine futalosine cyclase [Desulfovibrio sp.]
MIQRSGFQPVRRNATFGQIASKEEVKEPEAPWLSQARLFTKAHNPFAETAEVAEAAHCVEAGQRLSRSQAEALYYQASLETLAHLAHALRLKKHPEAIVTYVGDRNINYSNVCVCGCRFCAFFRPPGDSEGYVITREEMRQKVEETLKLGGTQILLQGGHHPDLPLSWYEELLSWLHTNWPDLHIHAFSPPEIAYWSQKFALPVPEILKRLQSCGLASIPGGGAEILHNAVRAQVSPNKCSADTWLEVMRQAHKLGMRTTATMMFGHEEAPSHRLDHLFALRALQDETHGFTAFIPWTFQPENTRIHVPTLPAPAYLRLLAVSRLVLDNFDNIQASWVTMGPEIGQCALFYGANDYGSLMIEENVVAAAGVSFHMDRAQIHAVIRAAGYQPVQRTMDYRPVDPQPLV